MRRIASENFFGTFDNAFDRPESPDAFVAAGEHSFLWADEVHSPLLQLLDVFLRGRVLPHLSVHGRGHEDGSKCGKMDGREGVSAETVRKLRHTIGRRGGDKNEIALVGELDVAGTPAFLLVVKAGSDRILKAMNRLHTREEYFELINNIKTIIPDCAISQDMIAGFPGESEEDHQDTLSLMEYVQYDFGFMFAYSERPGTLAERKMGDDIPETVKKRRLNEIIQLQQKHSLD